MGIINTFDQCRAAGGNRIAIYYYPPERGRCAKYARWSVSRIVNGIPSMTDNVGWYNNGCKEFIIRNCRTEKRKALEEAIAWTTLTFGPREFVRNRVGDYVEKEVNDKFPIPRRRNGTP